MDGKSDLEKNPIYKCGKTVKINVKMPHVNIKTTSEKTNFCSNPFSNSTLDLEQKKLRRKIALF